MSQLTIRPANENDLDFGFEMTVSAGGGLIEKAMGAGSRELAKKVFARLWSGKPNRFHFKNACVAESEGRQLGFLLSYNAGVKDQSSLPVGEMLSAGGLKLISFYLFRPLMAMQSLALTEGKPGEWHIGAIATVDEVRGRGIGSELLRHAFRLAEDAGLSKASLLVSQNNESAFRLYVRFGFTIERVIRKPREAYRMLAEW
ncbi:MAG: N-acetyltransferase [Clostridia bacterium]